MRRMLLSLVVAGLIVGSTGCGGGAGGHAAQRAIDAAAQEAMVPIAEELLPQFMATVLSPEILAEDCRMHVGFLAADFCRGRLTGSHGARLAAAYIAAAYAEAGLEPISKADGFEQPFEFTAGVRAVKGKNTLTITPPGESAVAIPCARDEDFQTLAFSANGQAEGEIAFVGYGIVEPQDSGKGRDAYAGLDVTGKIVMAMRYLPEDVSSERRQQLSVYAGSRYKARLAADRGATAFLLVTGPKSPKAGSLVKLRPNDRVSPVPIVAVSISGKLADRLLSMGGSKDLEAWQSTYDTEPVDPHVARKLNNVKVRLSAQLERVRKTCANVIGVLPPTGGASGYVMVGAHYDHIGNGVGLGSMARQGEEAQIHNGADDNASGTAAVLELAGCIAAARREAGTATPQRGVIFACWSGEELGLIGSSHHASHPSVPLDQIVAYFNFDMVGRLRDDKLILQAVGSSPAWPVLIERHGAADGLNLTTQSDPYLPTDATAFYTKGIPGLSFFTGSHGDYNRPTDDADTLNYDGLQRIATLAQRLIGEATTPDVEIAYARVKRTSPARTRGGVRAFTGTVPDFASDDVEGVRLADVRPDGPAEKAGIKAGDVIVEFAGRKITNLQDYSDSLIGAKIGRPVGIVVKRDQKRLSFTITPTSRPE